MSSLPQAPIVLRVAIVSMAAVLCGYPEPCVGQSSGQAEAQRPLFRGAYRIWDGGIGVYPHLWDECRRVVLFEGLGTDELVPVVLVPEAHRRRRRPSLTGLDASSVIARFTRTSPDGRWLLWPSNHRLGDAARGWSVRRLRGGEIRRWADDPESGLSSASWLRSSDAWVEFSPGSAPRSLAVHPIDEGRREVYRTVPGEPEVGTIVGITRHREALFLGLRRSGRIDFFTIGLPPREPVRRSFGIELPAGARLAGLDLSPRGDRLGWVLALPIDRDDYPGYDFWLSFWASRVDGSRLREIGRFPSHYQNSEPSTGITDLKWTPDSHALTFDFQDDLWGIRVP
jgi:hypothetical protein